MQMTSKILDEVNINAMVKALRQHAVFTIARDRQTIVVTHKTAGTVLRALRARPGVWITRHASDLFATTEAVR